MAKLRPLRPAEMDELWRVYQAVPSSREMIVAHVRRLAQRDLGITYLGSRPLLGPPPPDAAAGEVHLGEVMYDGRALSPFGLRLAELLQHTGIFGRSGAGKTNCGLLICRHLLRTGIPFLVLDWKRTYREMLQWPEASELLVLTAGREPAPFRLDAFATPHGIDQESWLRKLADIVVRAYDLGEGASYLLQKGVKSVSESSTGMWSDVVAWLERLPARGRESQWLASALRAASGIGNGALGKVLAEGRERGSDLADLLRRPVVIEMDALGVTERLFLVGVLLTWIHQYRMAEGRRETLKHVLVLEEAHHVLGRGGSEGIPELLMREVRELGEGVVILDQHPSLVSLPALGNTFCTIALNQKHQRDVQAIGRALLLADDDRSLLGQLPIGHAVVKLQDRWQRPFEIRLAHSGLQKGVIGDDAVRRRWLTLSAHSAEEVVPNRHPEQPLHSRAGEDLDSSAKALFLDVARVPFSPLGERLARCGLSGWTGEHATTRLLHAGLVEAGMVRVGRTRRRILRLTPTGRTLVQELGEEPLEPPPRGGVMHEYWKYHAAELLRSVGLSVHPEVNVSGHVVDLVVGNGPSRALVEIETGESDWRSNLERCRSAGGTLVIVSTSRALLGELRRHVRAAGCEALVHVLSVDEIGRLPGIFAEAQAHSAQ